MSSLTIVLLILLVGAIGCAGYFYRRMYRIRQIERQKADNRRSAFISIISHQLRTPLSVIKGYLEGVLTGDQGPLNDGQKEYLQEALDINHDTIKLVNDYLEVVRLDIDKLIIHLERIQLEELVAEEVSKLTPLARASNCELVYTPPASALPSVQADRIKLRQVIENILTNAIKYTNGKGRAVITLEQRDGAIRFSVADNGVGVPQDQLDEVFTKFTRGKNVIQKNTQGSGIGLFLARMIVTAHGGEIWLDSKENKGTTVYFTLPIEQD
ncbi:MAG: HAMP domain-containing histidine kinase [Candidatus Kerfeldbacteria bacterium]|nr:HAMP domain-containing histidine kinase [Candidatus Kerfeldbacteria bacterium]